MLEFGLSQQEFRARYVERQVYLRPGALRERPMQWSDLDALLHHLEPDESSVQLFNKGQLPPQAYIDEGFELGRPRRRLNQHRFYGLMQNGATMVLNRVESQSLPAKHLCDEVGRFVGHQTTGNAYASFGGNGTFGKHWDTHDVFAIQLIGRKRWQIFAPTFPFPLSNHTSESHQHQCPPTPAVDCVLSAGDVLYVPRGWWHQTLPFDEGSLHLSVGVYQPTLMDYMMWLSSRFLPTQTAARKGLIDDAATLKDLAELLKSSGQALLNPQHLADFKKEMISRERLIGEFNIGLLTNKNGAALDEGTVLALTSHYTPDTENSELPVNGGRLRLEPVSRAIVRALSSTLSLKLSELYARMPQVPPPVIHKAVSELVSYEVLTIRRG